MDLHITLPPALALPGDQGQHYAFLSSVIPPYLVQASTQNRSGLRGVKPLVAPWYAQATPAQKDTLKTVLDATWQSTNAWEKLQGKVQTLVAFARPLLETALKQAGHELDVEQTFVRLYSPVQDTFGRATGGFVPKTFSLLQAALNNFEAPETAIGYFNSASGFITQPDERGHFERHPTRMRLEAFARLCRDLDLGGQYQAYLQSHLRSDDVVSQAVLRQRYLTAQKDAFSAAAHLALLQGDIGDSDFALLMRVASGEKNIRVGDKQLWYRTPTVMNLRLQGCVLIEPCVKYRYSTWFIAWFPNDPQHPIKRYETSSAFVQAMTDRLTQGATRADRSQAWSPTDFQLFFSRFVAQKDRPYYFHRLTELVVDAPLQSQAAQWLRSEQGRFWSGVLAPETRWASSSLGDPAHTSRVPVSGPNLHINGVAFKQIWEEVDLWEELYEGMLVRLFDDAKTQAIPTADADARDRSRRLSHYLNLGLLVVNVVSMAVPPLGYAMLAVTAGQLLYETFEGVVDMAQGDREAGWSHLNDVVENLAMLAAGGVAFHFTVSPFIEQLKSVRLPGGKTRLWKPDIQPYVADIALAPESVASEEGVYRRANQHVLNLEGRTFVLKREPYPGKSRLQHPGRLEAYQPEVRHNGVGGWVHEAEYPLGWEQPRLMRRLGPFLDGLSDAQLEQIRRVSDVDESVLRRLHVESEPVPAVLIDTARQFRAYADAVSVSEQIDRGRLSSRLASYAAALMVHLPGWPRAWAIEGFRGEGGDAVLYGDGITPVQKVIRISLPDLMAGKLPERVARALSDEHARELLGQHAPHDPLQRATLLQNRLAQHARQYRSTLFQSFYADQQPPTEKAVQLLQRDFKGVPAIMARELLARARPSQVGALETRGKVPLALATQAHQLQRQMRLVRAYAGLYLDALANPDTEALVLNTLETLPGWQDDLRLEVRAEGFNGALRASYGPVNASHRKVIVQVADGQYQAFDEEANALHGINSFYDSLQHALTDAHRTSLGLPHVGQGLALKALIQRYALPRQQLLKVLGMQPDSRPFFVPARRLPDGRRGYPLSGRGQGTWGQIIEERVRALFPDISTEELTQLRADNDPFNDQWLKNLEGEYKTLDHTLQTWLSAPIEGVGEFGSAAYRRQLQVRSKIVRALKDAWRGIGPRHIDHLGNYLGQQIDLSGVRIRRQLNSLPALTARFGHVSELNLSESDFGDDNHRFLTYFTGVSSLNLENCRLTRLPAPLSRMPRLGVLSLSENHIVLDAHGVAQLRALRSLWMLELEGNPLGLAPDVSQMPNLQMLLLSNTGLDRWPTGLLGRVRPRGFYLNMTANRLSRIPDVAPGSDRAALIARTVVDRNLLSPDVLARLKLYIESIGLDPERRFPPRGAQDSIHWKGELTPTQWEAKQPLWDALEASPGAEGFFDEIRKLSESSDAASPAYKHELAAKVWRMLEAAYADASLRDKLFQMASAPTTCVDAGAQLFNAMGVEVLLSEAYSVPNEQLVGLELLDLAKGKSRLDELGRIAHARVGELLKSGRRFAQYNGNGDPIVHRDAQGRVLRPIDEVEIYLAYVTGLAQRLDLPWQSRSMMFREPDVTAAMLDAAFERVTRLEQGDLLRENLLEQDFWCTYLEGANRAQFDELKAKADALDDLLVAQQTWAADGGLAAPHKLALRKTIEEAGRRLGLPASELSPGQVMSDEVYFAQLSAMGVARKNLLRQLSDQALGRTP